MAIELAEADLSKGLGSIAAGLDEVLAAGLEPVDSPEAIGLIRELETLGRRLDAAKVELLDAIDHKGLHRVDGHHSAKVMVRHVAKLSAPEAAARAKTAKALRALPATRQAFRDGEDGTCDTNQANHERRNAHLSQDYDGGWSLDASCGSLSGAELHAIFTKFLDAEFQSDWEKAKIEHGDATTKEHLERSDAQRRFDALYAIFQRAASTPPGGKGPEIVLNLVMDLATYERHLAALATGARAPADPDDESYRCSTIDGHPIEATEAVVASLLGKLRRVVIGSDSVVVDLGRSQRLFTGSARLATMLADRECFWPGCHVPVSQCQIDHLIPFTERDDGGGGGRTDPGNGGPACGKHNRLKEAGYTVWRDPAGRWHVVRPDGTKIE